LADPSAIGVLGGIFDPIHNGHLALAHCALDYFRLQTFLLVPAGKPPHKSTSGVSVEHRIAMVRLALSRDHELTLWDGEIKRGGTSYSIDTLHALSKVHPGKSIYFIIGADNLREIKTWHRYREILDRVTLCVAGRPGYSQDIPRELAKAKILFFPSPEWGISSTMIRTYLKQGLSCRHLVPENVLDYISKQGLYK
jgi:nicotinate-nucleotide adenylyltransferase